MTINEIELYDVEAVDEVLSHLSNGDANVIQEKILQAGNILDAKTITEYETKRIPGCIQDIAPNKRWSNTFGG